MLYVLRCRLDILHPVDLNFDLASYIATWKYSTTKNSNQYMTNNKL